MSYIIYFLITIIILVFVHEFGHFAAAKISRMRVDIFAIGFGKRLFGWNKLNGFTFGDLPEDFDGQGNTDYRVCLLPFGGYVKIAGMVDESFDVKFAETTPQPDEFRARPTYQKLFVITAGVLMNLLLAFVIFSGINYFQQKPVWKTTTINNVAKESPADKAGFKTNDKILSVNGKKVVYWDDVINQIFINNMGKSFNVTVERNGTEKTLEVQRKVINPDPAKSLTLMPAGFKVNIDSVIKGYPAEKAGLSKGDVLLELDNHAIALRSQATEIISAGKSRQLPITILRGRDTLTLGITPGKDGKIGAFLHDEVAPGVMELRSFGLLESIGNGISDIGRFTGLTFSMLSNVIKGNIEFSSAFGGPVKIAQYAAKTADSGIVTFIFFLATLSLSLAIINILPFPVLDGGHFVIILIEGIIKREIPIKIKIAIQNVGFVILLLFMVFAIYNDIISL